jgi:hypothetical protein
MRQLNLENNKSRTKSFGIIHKKQNEKKKSSSRNKTQFFTRPNQFLLDSALGLVVFVADCQC